MKVLAFTIFRNGTEAKEELDCKAILTLPDGCESYGSLEKMMEDILKKLYGTEHVIRRVDSSECKRCRTPLSKEDIDGSFPGICLKCMEADDKAAHADSESKGLSEQKGPRAIPKGRPKPEVCSKCGHRLGKWECDPCIACRMK